MKTTTIVVALFLTISISLGFVLSTCSVEELASIMHRSKNLSEDHKLVKIGMTYDEVIDAIGKPDEELQSKRGILTFLYDDRSKVPMETLLIRFKNKEVVEVKFL